MELAMPEFQWPGIKKPFSSISGGAFFGEHELSFARCSRWGRRAGFYRGQGENRSRAGGAASDEKYRNERGNGVG